MYKRLGILGGGQLARMLAQAAHRRGLEVSVLARGPRPPAAIEGVRIVRGDLEDEAALDALFATSDVVTLENEFVDLSKLRRVLQRHPGVPLRPGLKGLAVAQDKLQQKHVFQRLSLPTAEFLALPAPAGDFDFARLLERFPGGFVLKQSRFGYDGKGNLVVDGPGDAALREAVGFCRAGEALGATIYAERKIDFEAEVAMVSTRSPSGEHRHFPLVVSHQERGVCREVRGPATALGFDRALEERTRAMLRGLGDELELTGTYALELFVTKAGELLVNEMAPRVHNTGHYSLYGDEPSQFDLHVEAVTEQPLTPPRVRGLVAMRNLLGPWSVEPRRPCPPPALPPPEGVDLYWYGKTTVSPGRKMGHLTARAESLEALEAVRHTMADYEDQIWAELLSERTEEGPRT